VGPRACVCEGEVGGGSIKYICKFLISRYIDISAVTFVDDGWGCDMRSRSRSRKREKKKEEKGTELQEKAAWLRCVVCRWGS
jgi:hypothetical protein